MREGWDADAYLILFDDDESPLASERYGVASMLPGVQIIGLRGWDDFIVREGLDGCSPFLRSPVMRSI